MQLRLLNVAVDGGDMRVLLWGTGKRVAVAVHGITASGMSWQAVARHMPPDWTLAAPDLRGRGHSRDLPGPFGLDTHARDVMAVLRHFGGRPVLAGHSMGAYVALLARDAHPELVRRLVLVDGGLPLPVPDGTDLDAVLDATLGPAIARLGKTFPSTEAYVDFWRAHPALAAHWSPDVEAYARYDLTGEPGQLRSRAVEDAVRADGRDVLAEKPFVDALQRRRLGQPLQRVHERLLGQHVAAVGADRVLYRPRPQLARLAGQVVARVRLDVGGPVRGQRRMRTPEIHVRLGAGEGLPQPRDRRAQGGVEHRVQVGAVRHRQRQPAVDQHQPAHQFRVRVARQQRDIGAHRMPGEDRTPAEMAQHRHHVPGVSVQAERAGQVA